MTEDTMSHLHVPDGLLPIWIVVIGWIISGGILLIITRRFSPNYPHL